MQDFGSRPPRQMDDDFALHIKCSESGHEVKELPFQPTEKADGTLGKIYCRDCNRKRREAFRSSGFGGQGGRF